MATTRCNVITGIAESAQYDAFGASAGYALTRYDYTGRERDQVTASLYYRARWYDPSQGRFLSEDPAGFQGGTNLYAYVLNNPISNTDASGLYRDCAAEQIQCFRNCWARNPPWPCEKGKGSHYRYCQSLCLERAAEAARQAAKWLADHPWVLVGTIILISGVLFIVVVVGGGLVLTPLAA